MHCQRIPTVLTLALALTTSTVAQDPVAQDQKAAAKLDEKAYDHFGAGISTGTEATPLTEVLKNPAAFVDKPVRISGPITGVCQVKGCWMNLGAPDATGNPPVFVKFKDYAFFVPKDASGRTAILDGTMTMTQETVEQTRHYLEDAGKHEEAQKVTEGRKIYRFMASGVAIKKPGKLDEARYDHFGAGVMDGPAAVAVADVAKDPQAYTGKVVRLTGPITAVCQTKGCWMNVGAPDAKGNPPVFVKFKDYAFFVPKDASGRTAILEGTMTVKQETVEETRHYLEDAGKHEEAQKVTEGRKLLHFMASGVAIEKRADGASAAKPSGGGAEHGK